MSWEGYEVTVCENAHIVTLDPHADIGNKCPKCGGKVVQYFQFDCTNGDEAESRHNRRKWNTVNRVADKILRSNPEEIERRIKDAQERKLKFLEGIQNTLNNYDKEIERLLGMLLCDNETSTKKGKKNESFRN